MPSRNVVKTDASEQYYHVYLRGASKQQIYLSKEDRDYFLNLFSRYLSAQPIANSAGEPYPHLQSKLSLSGYCLMGNHFHLLLYQHVAGNMSRLMKSLISSYTLYFNRKYSRTGSLFESTYKASQISSAVYLQHISRYIHLNPRYWRRYPYSSLKYYTNQSPPEWLDPSSILELFSSKEEYLKFLRSYESRKIVLEDIKHELAGC